MDIIHQKIPILGSSRQELEEILLQLVLRNHRRSLTPNLRAEFLNLLPYRDATPFDQLGYVGTHSNAVSDLIHAMDINFPQRFQWTLTEILFYIRDDIERVSVSELESISGITPFLSRCFHFQVRGDNCPIKRGTALLTYHVKEWLRARGFYVPNRLDAIDYRRYEQTFLLEMQKAKQEQKS